MKTLYSLVILFIMVGLSYGQITGSAHDFSGDIWNSSGEICIVCHTPHNADVSVAEAPLWNHEVTVATFTPYSSVTLDATVGQPNNSSKLCLSCHDGTVALDNFGGQTGGINIIGGTELLGIDLSDDHPVSFGYDATLASNDDGLYDPSTALSGLGGTIDADLLLGGQLECASCHDVHNGSGLNNLLKKNNASSALCFTCHSK